VVSLRHCAVCRWVGATRWPGLDSGLSRCLHPTSLQHALSCLIARSCTSWGGGEDICGPDGQHWQPRDSGESVEAAVDSPRGGSDGAEAEPA
jgi:hypothetical protein